jgi:flagellar export protein FliJ
MTPKTLKRTLAIKERVRQWRRAELMDAEARVANAQHDVAVEEERHEGTCALITRAGEVSPHDLILASEQLAMTQLAVKKARVELETREVEREQRREIVGEATREVRAIETLHTRLLAEQKHAADKREQADMDEASANKVRASR